MDLTFTLDGRDVTVDLDDDVPQSLLHVLRRRLGITSAGDGCAPQGQCGSCTVLIDGTARVACVTPARRVAGRSVTTLDGLSADVRDAWAATFLAAGASQCGVCTPGIIVRLEAVRARTGAAPTAAEVERALAAHLCRCTGWRSIVDAGVSVRIGDGPDPGRDATAASARATLEGRAPQRIDTDTVLGHTGAAADSVPADALWGLPDPRGGWTVRASLPEARVAVGTVQGRRTTEDAHPPLEPPPGEWAATLATCWVDPAAVEAEVSWCEPGGEPASPTGNGGAFGAKVDSPVTQAARRLADEHDRPVVAVWRREDSIRHGAKRPPLAAGIRADGTGVVRVARTPGVAAAIHSVAPGLAVEEVDVPGPPTSLALRAAGWAEAVALLAAVGGDGAAVHVEGDAVALTVPGQGPVRVTPSGARGGRIASVLVEVDAGEPLDVVVLRSYCVGAVHMGLSWVTSESLAVADDGEVLDLTIRSLGVLRAADTPSVEVVVGPAGGPPVPVSDAVFAATAAAVWRWRGLPPTWPVG
jgi:xanthine dehydrogenase small subunit